MNKADYKKFSKALFILTELRTYPNNKNLDFVESKFLNYFGKVIGKLMEIFIQFYTANKRDEKLKEIATILNYIDKEGREMKIELTEYEREKILKALYEYFCFDCDAEDYECPIKPLIEKFGGKCQFQEEENEQSKTA